MNELNPLEGLGERLRAYLKHKGIGVNQAARLVGTSGSQISNILHGKVFGTDKLYSILNTFNDLNIEWLLEGKGEMHVPQNVPSHVPPLQKNPLESYTKTGYINKVEEGRKPYPMKEAVMVTVDNLGHDNIAYVPVKAQAGYLTGYKDKEYFEKLPAFALPGFKNDVYRAFEVSGYSMLPAEGVGLYPGDIIIAAFLDHPHKIRDSRVYVIVCDAPEVDNIIVKRCLNRLEANNKIICFSDNKNGDYPAIILEPDQIKEIWEFKAKISRHIPPPGSIFDQLNDLSGRLVIVEEKLKQNKLNKYHNSNDD